jgi:hypothetical protein
MKNIFISWIIILMIAGFLGCDMGEPAKNDGESGYNPQIHRLEKIEGLSGSKTLVLASTNSQTYPSGKTLNSAVSDRCDELGEISDSLYRKMEHQGNLTPCFKGIRRWKGNIIYGQYRPSDSSQDVWFITDVNGNVHHLPKAPKKGSGFKNEGHIKEFNGKPAYLDYLSRLATFSMENDLEEIIINDPIGRFVVIDKPSDGDHIVYTDLDGGQRRKPSGDTERLGELDMYKSFYKNPSGDLDYIASMRFKRMLFEEDGSISDKTASPVPVAYQEYLDNAAPGSVAPLGPVFGGGLEGCEMSENLIICGAKGFVVADSSSDLKEINWLDFEGYGNNQLICLSENYIYYYSEYDWIQNNIPQYERNLTQIDRDLSGFEHILTDESIRQLSCLTNGDLLIKTDSQVFEFDPVSKIKTMLPETVTEFVN